MAVPPALAVLVPLLMQFEYSECGPTVAQLAASGNLLAVFDGVADVGAYTTCADMADSHWCPVQIYLSSPVCATSARLTGLCVPSNCTGPLLAAALQPLAAPLGAALAATYSQYCGANTSVSFVPAPCADDYPAPLDTAGGPVVVGVCAALVLLGLAVAVARRLSDWLDASCGAAPPIPPPGASSVQAERRAAAATAEEAQPLRPSTPAAGGDADDGAGQPQKPPKLARRPPAGVGSRAVAAVDAADNFLELVAGGGASAAARRTAFLDGMRVLSMGWVVFGHALFFPLLLPGFANVSDVLAFFNSWGSLTVQDGYYAVDTFFFLSGLLAGLASGRRGSSAATASPLRLGVGVFMVALRRWLRIVPTLGLVIALGYWVTRYTGDGPYAGALVGDQMYTDCGDWWWTNVLLVNSFVPWSEGNTQPAHSCMGWMWYVSCDFWFTVVGAALLAATARLPTLGRVGACLAVAIAAVGLTCRRDLFLSADYSRPWTRAAPYFFGLAFSLLLDAVATPSPPSSGWAAAARRAVDRPATRWALYTAAVAAGATCINYSWWYLHAGSVAATHSTPGDKHSPTQVLHSLVYFGLWGPALGVACVVWACGHGGPVRRFLGHSAWAPASRLTFGAYLLHPLVSDVFAAQTTAPYRFTYVWLVGDFLRLAAAAYLVAIPLHVFCERPLGRLSDLVLDALTPRPPPRAPPLG